MSRTREQERELVKKVFITSLARCDGNVSRAAREISVNYKPTIAKYRDNDPDFDRLVIDMIQHGDYTRT
jgi:hypothetical protein